MVRTSARGTVMAGPTTQEKALQINVEAARYGTFAEIGPGQEGARCFFPGGGAAGTVAKTISAYDTAVSDSMYGPSDRYVSRQRLQAMLEREYACFSKGSGHGAAIEAPSSFSPTRSRCEAIRG